MKRDRFVVLATLVLAGCVSNDTPSGDTARPVIDSGAAPAPSASSTMPTTASTRWVVSPTGFGPVLAGMSLDSLGKVLGEPLHAASTDPEACSYVRPAALPQGVLVMVLKDTVARVDVRSAGVLTAEGAGVGDSEASVLARYKGRIRTEPHKYTGPTGHYLLVAAPPDTSHLIIFETDGSKVVNYRAGRRPDVELVEGCS